MSLTFARRTAALNPSPTLALDSRVKKMKLAGEDVLSFGVGEPDFDTPVNAKEAAKRAIDAGFTKYTPSSGTDSLKTAIASRYEKDHGIEVKNSEIVVSNGAKHSLFNIALALFGSGDEVLIPSPYWVSYPEQVMMADAKPVFIETGPRDEFKITPAVLKKAITARTKAIILNSPSNPTGTVYTRDELKALIRVLEKTGIYLIADEIYDKLVFDQPFTTVLELISRKSPLRERTIVVNGVSKAYAMTGWRIGYIIADERVSRVIENIQSQSTSNPSSISQKAAEEALSGEQGCVKHMLAEFKKRRDLIYRLLAGIDGVRVTRPAGSFYIFPDLSSFLGKSAGGKQIMNTVQLCEYLLDDARVGIVPGEAFGAVGFARLSFATTRENIKEGIKRVKRTLGKLR